MKKRNKSIVLLAVFSAFLLLLSACAGEHVYKTDVSTEDIVRECAASISSYTSLASVDEDYITYRMLLDTSAVSGYSVYIQNTGASLDEIGIFACTSNDTAAVVAMVENYIKRRNDEWTGQYLVEEYPKLENAEYRVFGRYVVYGILSETDKTTLFSAVDQYLKAE